MRIPDTSEIREKEEAAKNKPKNIDLGKIVRKKDEKEKEKKKNKHLLRLIVILLGVIAFALVWVNADTIFEPLRGIASRIETKTSYNIGFPIDLPGSSDYSIRKFGDNFSLLTDTYLYAYDTTGSQLFALKHGYSKPHQTTNEKRVLLYDKSSYAFSVYSKSSVMYRKELEDKIVSAYIGSDSLAAVVTQSEKYSNVLYIYDDNGNWKYTKKFADENVMQVCSTGDGEHIMVSTISSTRGDITTNVYRYSIKSTGRYDWKYSITDNCLPVGMFADKEHVITVCDNTVFSLSTYDGKLSGSTEYTGQLRHFDINSERALVQYNDMSSNRNVLLVINENGESTSMAHVTAAAAQVLSDSDGIYVLDGTKLKVFDHNLIYENDITVTDDDYISFVKIGDNVYMLGYDTINTVPVELPDEELS